MATKPHPKNAKEKKQSVRMGGMDYTFFTILIIIVCAGLIMLLSASAPAANKKFGNSYHFFIRQLMYAVAGFVLMILISRWDFRRYKKYVGLFMLVCTVLLVLVFVPGIGVSHNGSRRWLDLIIFELQPSEFMKLAIAMFFASHIESGHRDLQTMKGLSFYAGWIVVVAALMMLETHLSGTIVICGIACVVLIVGGMNLKILGAGGILAVAAGSLFVFTDAERWARVISFLDPFADIKGEGWQVVQGLYAIGSGGFFGLGLGQSVQKYSYIPEPYNDFIFAVICEELGFVGAMLIIGLFAALIIRGIKIALNAPDKFAMLTVVGIITQVAIQTALNIAVVTSSIPNTGVTLPFFSSGGTALLVLLAEMGVVLNISRYSAKNR